jgi:hypothetical protein
MATKKKMNPVATALVIAAVGVTGFIVWKYVIAPRRNKLKAASMQDIIDSEPEPRDVIDAKFEVVNNQDYA